MIPELAAAIDEERPVVLATVVRTSRSVPRRPGSKMLVFDDGSTLGTVGGGAMEHRVTLEAAEVLAEGSPRLVSYRLLDPTDGDPGICGGDVDIYLEPYTPTPTVHVLGSGPAAAAIGELAIWLGLRAAVAADGTGPDPRSLGPRDAVVLVTDDPERDGHLVARLAGVPVGYVAVVGPHDPATTRAALEARGATGGGQDRVRTPAGNESGGGPKHVALVVLADLIDHHRRPGSPPS